MVSEDREFAVVLWGATGFTGSPHGSGVGRAPILVGDGDDEAFLAKLAARTKVVCTCSSWWSRWGIALGAIKPAVTVETPGR